MTTVVDTPVQSSLAVQALQPTIGAEISGVDLREPLTPEVRDQIRATLLKYKVVFFRDQELTQAQHEDFARQFGPLYTHPGAGNAGPDISPAIHRIASEDFKKHEKAHTPQAGDDVWEPYHTDTSWRLVPTWGAVLRAVHLPEVGGDTIWVDAALAYQGLPDEVKARLEGHHVTHDYRAALHQSGHDYPVVAHPIIRPHRETGAKTLWVNFTQRPTIVGLDRAESRELLTAVIDQYRKPANQVRFSWRPGSVAFWDNRATVHYAVRDYGTFPRLLERILIAEETLYADL
ncbi:taurine dioxygenase [Parafrankia irregularis]|uniref:Taurine dioxygenase n=1 Tax=Parafrankia irregularis TaxID=795642 RepID=A0A0S4QVX2_9ACTN|nr:MULTISPECIES: TauD/TfdA family dioxygenase [Parafrankia]MBE3205803.1 TauD/TfdA family dioxygenase [Parafrankia sp. CH37]CUU59677.1 taurine dioxygenase [Parafrankia irregularis]